LFCFELGDTGRALCAEKQKHVSFKIQVVQALILRPAPLHSMHFDSRLGARLGFRGEYKTGKIVIFLAAPGSDNEE